MPAQTTPISENLRAPDEGTLWQRLRFYCTPIDGRYEDLTKGPWYLNVFRDFTAGLIVAMVAIPLAMGFAMASGLPPEMGIVGGAVAGLVGALFGGSKYQVYGPTAAFIPVILAITTKYAGNSFLIWCSLIAGVILILMGVTRLGRLVARVPNSIVVGFTIGIAIVIALSQVEQVFGLTAKLEHGLIAKATGNRRALRRSQHLRRHHRDDDVPRDQVSAEGLEVHPGAADRAGSGHAPRDDDVVGQGPDRGEGQVRGHPR